MSANLEPLPRYRGAGVHVNGRLYAIEPLTRETVVDELICLTCGRAWSSRAALVEAHRIDDDGRVHHFAFLKEGVGLYVPPGPEVEVVCAQNGCGHVH
jgi:hypothetical protein